MLAKSTCDYLHNFGKVCGRACTQPEGCRHHYKCKKRIPCSDCGKPTGSACGRCNLRKRGFYMIRYVKKLREKTSSQFINATNLRERKCAFIMD